MKIVAAWYSQAWEVEVAENYKANESCFWNTHQEDVRVSSSVLLLSKSVYDAGLTIYLGFLERLWCCRKLEMKQTILLK